MVNLVTTAKNKRLFLKSVDNGEACVVGRDSSEDKVLHNRVNEALEAAGRPQLRAVSVAVTRGSVVLQGRVSSYYLKQVAQESVRGLANVKSVQNELQVN